MNKSDKPCWQISRCAVYTRKSSEEGLEQEFNSLHAQHEACEAFIRHIFRRYAALGSVRLLKAELEADDIAGKSWTSASGRRWDGNPLGRGALYLILRNRIYRGEIVHKDA